MERILIVCTGNTCRSPMAEYLLRDMIEKQGMSDEIQVTSAGIAAFGGEAANEKAIVALKERQIDASAHTAKQITPELIDWATRIYVMSEAHKAAIVSVIPEAVSKISVLGIPDPYGSSLEVYRDCLKILDGLLRKELARMTHFNTSGDPMK